MRRYLSSHVLVAIIYWLLLLVIGGGWSLDLAYWLNGLVMGAGVLLGVYMLFLDRLVYTYAYPQEQLSQHFVWYWKKKQYGQALALIDMRRGEQQKLTFRSILFIAVWVPLAFFALTSTAGVFGKGVVMGLMLHILYDAWRLQRIDPQRLNTRLFWQIKRKFGHEEQMVLLVIVTLIFGFFSFWV